jgi:hypothetical protein
LTAKEIMMAHMYAANSQNGAGGRRKHTPGWVRAASRNTAPVMVVVSTGMLRCGNSNGRLNT